jgi:hypothetical protein
MFNITHNDHIKFYTNNNLYIDSDNVNRKYSVKFGSVDFEYYKKNSYYEELKRVADLQYNLFGKDLIVFLSGGLDSEIAVRSFLNIGIIPRCVIIRFLNKLENKIENKKEVDDAVKTANSLGISYEIYDFDVLNFYLSNEAEEFAIKYKCSEFPILVYYKVSTLFAPYPCVFCCEVLLEKKKDVNFNPVWNVRFQENIEAATYRVCQDTKVPIVMEWYYYTPELLLYFLESDHIRKLTSTRNQYVTSTRIKNDVLKSLVKDVKDSNKVKTYGYENLTNMVVEANWKFKNLIPYRIDQTDYGTEYNEVIKMLKVNKC